MGKDGRPLSFIIERARSLSSPYAAELLTFGRSRATCDDGDAARRTENAHDERERRTTNVRVGESRAAPCTIRLDASATALFEARRMPLVSNSPGHAQCGPGIRPLVLLRIRGSAIVKGVMAVFTFISRLERPSAAALCDGAKRGNSPTPCRDGLESRRAVASRTNDVDRSAAPYGRNLGQIRIVSWLVIIASARCLRVDM